MAAQLRRTNTLASPDSFLPPPPPHRQQPCRQHSTVAFASSLSSLDPLAGYYSHDLVDLTASPPPSLERANTVPSRMESLVSSNEARISALLGHLDSALSFSSSSAAVGSFNLDSPPVPSVSLEVTSTMPLHTHANEAAYDSGLGSSVQSTKKPAASTVHPSRANAGLGSVSAPSVKTAIQTRSSSGKLSRRSCRIIKDIIFDPLKRQDRFKAYHPIVNDAPVRMVNKQIQCLRDLEKFILFMASTSVKTLSLYQDFCVFTINAVETAAGLIPETEHHRSNDQPYSTGYFTNLVEQVHTYARTVAEQRRRRAAGEPVEDIGTLRLHGGMSQTGRPATLVVERENGLAAVGDKTTATLSKDLIFEGTGVPKAGYTAYSHAFTRSHIKRESVDDGYDSEVEEAYRSQARRVRQKMTDRETGPRSCANCGKVFERACDLTKHEKTHSRPFKCPESSCRYHDYGWPTEKEMERHYNDKHSNSPVMHRCHYHPCDYESKRESNLKQHMEKAHGWNYVRSKRPTTKTRKTSISQSPASANHSTPSSNPVSTPRTTASYMDESPLVQPSHTFASPYVAPESYAEIPEPDFDFNNDFQAAWNPDVSFDFNTLDFQTLTTIPGHPVPGVDFNDPTVSNGFLSDSALSPEFTYDNAQLFTPQHSTEMRAYDSFDEDGLYAAPPSNLVLQNPVNPLYYSPASQDNLALNSFGADFPLMDQGFDAEMTDSFFPPLDEVTVEQPVWMHEFVNE